MADAMLSVMPWFMRYHKGGYDNAYKIAVKKQKEKRDLILTSIIELYQKY